MANASTKVYSHLTELKKYFEEDIKQLHGLSISAEAEEQKRGYSFTTTVKEGPNAPYHWVIPWPPIPRCTIPQGLTLLSVADYLGYLVKSGNNNYKSTEENMIEFFAKAESYGICSHIPANQLLLLNQCARQEMVHNYLPKLDLEVSYHSGNPTGKLFFLHTETGGVVLNVNELKWIVLETLDKLLSDPDQPLYQNMEAHYLHAEAEYEAQVKTLIQNVKASL